MNPAEVKATPGDDVYPDAVLPSILYCCVSPTAHQTRCQEHLCGLALVQVQVFPREVSRGRILEPVSLLILELLTEFSQSHCSSLAYKRSRNVPAMWDRPQWWRNCQAHPRPVPILHDNKKINKRFFFSTSCNVKLLKIKISCTLMGKHTVFVAFPW